MRLIALLAFAGTAYAEPPRATMIRVEHPPVSTAAVSSHIIYLNRCNVGGCPVQFGTTDDSRTQTSSIAMGDVTIGAFTQTDQVWDAMLACVQATYAAFDVTITDVDPGNVPHFEEIVGGTPGQLRNDIPNAGGVAPFDCDEVPNGISFTFDVYGPNPDYLCWTVAQETAHTFGLEHEFLQKDPMTYLQGNLPKRFQWAAAPCGTDSPAACQCQAGMQNSYQHIYNLFGVGAATPPTVTITSPVDGKKVTPSFHVAVDAEDDAAIDHVELWIDGAMVDQLTIAPYVFTAPASLTDGAHAIEVHAIDTTMMASLATINVTQGPPCTAAAGCEGTDVCVMGSCIAGPNQPGGLGNICASDQQCLSMVCADAGETFKHCVAACDPGTNGSCPNNFDCLPADQGGVCWPSPGGGCCSATGDPRGSLAVCVVVLLARRRRR